MPADDDELLRALVDPDLTVRRIAAVRARKLPLASPAIVLAALEPLLAHADKYLRRAAAASYVALHPAGPAAPALRPLHADPADMVVLTARGGLRDPGHELAELGFVLRALAYATRSGARDFATTAVRWHRFLWSYSPNPRVATLPVAPEALARDAAVLRDALLPAEPARELTILLAPDGLAIERREHGRVRGRSVRRASLPAMNQLAARDWHPEDAPWPTMLAGGIFALAVIAAFEAQPRAWLGEYPEVELSAAVGDRERFFLGFVRADGIAFAE